MTRVLSKWSWLFLLTLFFSCNRVKDSEISQIAEEDRKILNAFFEVILRQSPSGFTLFGDKPISFYCYILPSEEEEITERNIFSVLMEEGWKVFKKYQHIFPTSHFHLKRSLNPLDPLPVVYITLVNKKSALNVVVENISHFKSKYGKSFDPESYLNSLEHIAYESSNLVGILMGYGVQSGWAFHRAITISRFYRERPSAFEKDKVHMPDVPEEWVLGRISLEVEKTISDDLLPSIGFSSLAEELNYLMKHYSFFEIEGAHFLLSEVGLPEFACLDCDKEIIRSKIKYKQTLIALLERLKGKVLLEEVIRQWKKD